MCEKLGADPHHLFRSIQAAIGGKVIARETISALRRDVRRSATAVTSPEAQAAHKQEGKKRMRQFGKVDILQQAFIKR